MTVLIADTAYVDPAAELADGVEVGPYCIVGPGVRLGRGTRLLAHVCLHGAATFGADNLIAPFVSIGSATCPYGPGSPGLIEVGDRSRFAAGVVVDPPRESGGRTRIGSHVAIGPHAHISADCEVGDRARVDSGAVLGEHVRVGVGAIVSAGVTVHPRVNLGPHSFVGGPTRVFHDVPPYLLADGHPAKVRGLHIVGLKRLGLEPGSVRGLHEAHRLLYRGKIEAESAAEQLRSRGQETPEVAELIAFVRDQRQGAHGRARDRLANGLVDDQAA